MSNTAKALAKLDSILEGIDQTEDSDSGWWETSTGADFGASKLEELRQLITDLTKENTNANS